MSALSEIIEKADVEEGWKKDAREELANLRAVAGAAKKVIDSHEEDASNRGEGMLTMSTMTYKVEPLTTLEDACRYAVRLAVESGNTVEFKFNDVPLVARADDDPEEIKRDYFRQLRKD